MLQPIPADIESQPPVVPNTHVDELLPDAEVPELHAGTHSSRLAQQRVLTDPDDADAWHTLESNYARQATSWRDWTRGQEGYDWPVRAGLAHIAPAAWAVELCCGTGEATRAIIEAVPRVVATDVNTAMLAERDDIPGVEWRAANVRALPFADHGVMLIVALNGVLFPSEIRRVLSPGGQLLWCTAFGPRTPLYVEPTQIHRSFGMDWQILQGRSGHGQWTLLTAPD
ncbi:class I SAM-dependent methyltransferase (plasmid) [Embleya sp. NBC_00888]|uniref:class I SAM-dependent methyltransferase n=1 Tax=Embleya sp. NBC_00888 TaxID=2975960 RepID=UPI002F912EF6|nr:class I SAM-dependent methyltransferase [Embleya sp. NBC_00888]